MDLETQEASQPSWHDHVALKRRWRDRLHLPYRDDTLFSIVAFATFVIPLALSPYLYENYETIKYAIFLVAAGIGLIVFLRQKPLALPWQPAFISTLGLFIVWSVLTLIHSQDSLNTVFGYAGRLTSSIVFYGAWALYGVLLLATLTREKFLFLVKILVFDAFIIAVWALLQNIGIGFYSPFWKGMLPEEVLPRVPSLLGNPNFSSMFIVSILPFALGFLAQTQRLAARLYYGLTIFCIAWTVILFGSRGGIIALAIAVITAIVATSWFQFNKRTLGYGLVTLAITGLLFLGFFNSFRPNAVQTTLDFSEISVQNRFLAWSKTIDIISAHPWLGTGLGNFHVAFGKLRDASLVVGGNFDDAHNLFLHVTAMGGLPLGLLFITLIGIALFYGWRSLRNEYDWLTVATIAALAGYLLSAAFTPVVVPCWFLLMILLTGLLYPYVRNYPINRTMVVRVLGGVVGIALVVVGITYLTSEYLIYAGAQAYQDNQHDRSRSLVNVALWLNPFQQTALAYAIGNDVYDHKDAAAIRQRIERLQSLHATSVGTYYQVARSYLLLYYRDHDHADLEHYFAAMNTSLSMDPYAAERYSQTALWYYIDGHPDQALSYVYKLATLNPKDIQAWLFMAKIYQQQGKRDQLVFVLNKARLLYPDDQTLRQAWSDARTAVDIQTVFIPAQFAQSAQ